MIIDTHTHLDMITTDISNIRQILNECHKNNIELLFNISVDIKSNFNGKKLSESFKEIYFSTGIHPSEADKITLEDIKNIEKLLFHKKNIGIGEIGLDYYRNYASKKNQKKIFIEQLQIAEKYYKPVIIHSRNSFMDTFNIVKEFKVKGIFHCFSYSIKEALQIIKAGFFISFAGNLTFKNAKDLHEVAKLIPLENIIIETDSPFLAPEPVRGKKNYPYYIKHTINFLSILKKLPINKIEKMLLKNIKGLFF